MILTQISENLRNSNSAIKALLKVLKSSIPHLEFSKLVDRIIVEMKGSMSTQDFIKIFGKGSLSDAEETRPEQTIVVEIYNSANLFMNPNELPIKCTARINLLREQGVKVSFVTYEQIVEISKLKTVEEQEAEVLKRLIHNMK